MKKMIILVNKTESTQVLNGQKIRKNRLITIPSDTEYSENEWRLLDDKKNIKIKKTKINMEEKENDSSSVHSI